MNTQPNPAPAAIPQASAGASAPPSVQQCLALLSALGQAVQVLTDASSALVDSAPSQIADALIAVDDAADAVDTASAAVASAITAGGSFSLPTAPPATVATPAAPVAPAAPAFLRTTGPWIAGLLYVVVPTHPLAPVTDLNEKWFAITRGKYVGLTKNSAISLRAVTGVATGLHEKFSNQADALEHFNTALAANAVAIIV
ncbi:hypothetical protein C8R43DRAFT_945126 [Mycena crocata]|nr:hypothetical protein C8R43DRAFT_945126 [Mycena crocata]